MNLEIKPPNMALEIFSQHIIQEILSLKNAVIVIDFEGTTFDSVQCWLKDQSTEIQSNVDITHPLAQSTCAFDPLGWLSKVDFADPTVAVKDSFRLIVSQTPEAPTLWNLQSEKILISAIMLLVASNESLEGLPIVLSSPEFCATLITDAQSRLGSNTYFPPLLVDWSMYQRLRRTDQWNIWVEPARKSIDGRLYKRRASNLPLDNQRTLDPLQLLKSNTTLLMKAPRSEFGEAAVLLAALLIANLRLAADLMPQEKQPKIFVVTQ